MRISECFVRNTRYIHKTFLYLFQYFPQQLYVVLICVPRGPTAFTSFPSFATNSPSFSRLLFSFFLFCLVSARSFLPVVIDVPAKKALRGSAFRFIARETNETGNRLCRDGPSFPFLRCPFLFVFFYHFCSYHLLSLIQTRQFLRRSLQFVFHGGWKESLPPWRLVLEKMACCGQKRVLFAAYVHMFVCEAR